MEKTKKSEILITVFTPTYNRAHTLQRLYESLKRQTEYRFEWLIVDDGSEDHTPELIQKYRKENVLFSIRYYRQENGGKHRAVNFGITKANGKLFFIVDSDDYLADNAIEIILRMCETLPQHTAKKYAGVAGGKGHDNGSMVGSSFDGKTLDCLAIEREKYGITGDKAEVFLTEVLRKYPFPVFQGEKFVTEATVWDRISLDGYYIRYFNEIIYFCEYLEDGLTEQGLALYYKNPQGYGCYLRQARKAGKFEKKIQAYFDTACYQNWKNQMNIKEIADLIGSSVGILRWRVMMEACRTYGRAGKQLLTKYRKRGGEE